MAEKIHVHKLLETLSRRSYTLSELKDIFGKDAEFVNCKDVVFTFDTVIDFLKEKAKIVVEDDKISFNQEMKICSNH